MRIEYLAKNLIFNIGDWYIIEYSVIEALIYGLNYSRKVETINFNSFNFRVLCPMERIVMQRLSIVNIQLPVFFFLQN